MRHCCGGEAIAVQVDVCNPESMENLARRAVESYGRVDIWVNNAAVVAVCAGGRGSARGTPPSNRDQSARLSVRRAASRAHFSRQGRGVLVNVSSAAAYVGQPYTSAYVASKFGDSRSQRVHSPGGKRLPGNPRLHGAARFY